MQNKNIIETYLEEEMHEAFLEYSEEVIENRAIPNVYDGLKPVQRRILYAFYDLGITYDKPFKKSARVVGDVLGKWHPHGDSSVYDAMVRLGQPWNQRYPLVSIHGNSGSADGDKAAAMRYTEAKASEIAGEFFKNIEKDVLKWTSNFDDTLKEPVILPTLFPNYLVNGGMGIASGISCDIPPHNLSEVVKAIIYRIDSGSTDLKEYLKIVKGPDFPTGGTIEGKELGSIYETGLGKIKIRSKYKFEPHKNGKTLIVFTEIPYQKKNGNILEKAADLYKKGDLAGVSDIRDESSLEVGTRLVFEVKKDSDPNYILKTLFQKTDLEATQSIQMRAIMDGKLKTLSLIDYINGYLDFYKEFIRKLAESDLKKTKDILHIQEGFLLALDHIDEIVKIIKGSKDFKTAKAALINKYEFSDSQAQSILELRLSRLTSMGKKEVQDKIKLLKREIKGFEKLASSEKARLLKIKEELLLMTEKYSDKRRTKIVRSFEKIEAEKPVSEIFITISDRTIKTYQTRNIKSEYDMGIETNDDSTLLLFNKNGQFYKYPTSKLPSKVPFDVIWAQVLTEDEDKIFFISKKGQNKRVKISDFDIKRENSVAMKLDDDDEIIYMTNTSEVSEILLLSSNNDILRLELDHSPIYGRTAKGVKSIALTDDEYIVSVYTNYEKMVLKSGKSIKTVLKKDIQKLSPSKTYNLKKTYFKRAKTTLQVEID